MPDPMVRLDRIETLLARRPADREDLRLLTDRMSTGCVLFATADALAEGDRMEVRVLLYPGVHLRIPAVVTRLARLGRRLLGELRLEPGPEERAALLRHLHRHSLAAA